MRQLFIVPFSCHNGTERLIKEALNTGAQPHEIFYFTPSPRKLRATQLLFAQIYNRRAFIPPEFLTLRQLALKLTREYDSFRPFPEELKPLLVRHLFLRDKKPVTIGYARVVAGFITAVKRHLLPDDQIALPERLKKMDVFVGDKKVLHRLFEAHKIMGDYNSELIRWQWADNEDIFTRAPQLLKNIPSIKALILDSFVAPNRLEKELLKSLIEKAEITFALGYGTHDHDPRYDFACQFTDFILNQPNFSSEFLPASTPMPNPTVLRFPTAEEEIINICRRLREQAEKSNLKNTFVVFPRLDEYAPLVNRIFRQYEIPFTIYPEAPLASSPPIVAVLEFLTALNGDYERVSTAAALSSPFFPNLFRLSEKEKTLTARWMLNILSRRAGIIKGKKNWDNIAERIIRSEQLNQEDEEGLFLREVQHGVHQALGLVEKILKSEEASLGTQAHQLKQFLETIRYCQNLNPEDPTGSEIIEDRKKLYDILDTIVEFEADFGGNQETRADFISIISHLLSQSPKTPERELRGVIVLGMEETLGLTLDRLYFAGLTENALPGAYQPDPLIPERIKKKLGIPDIDWHRDWQRFHFHRTLSASPNLPWLSFPENRAGNPVLPTPFLQDLETRFSIQTPELGEENTVIYSEVEHQRYLGEEKNVTLEEITAPVDFTNEPQVQAVIAQRFGTDNYISVTGLERYLWCPFLFYLEKVLGLKMPPEPEYLLDAQQWGVILHEVFRRLYSSTIPTLEELETAVKGCLDDVLKKASLPRFWSEVTKRVFHNLLPAFIDQERNLRQAGFQPKKTEYTLKGSVTSDIKLKGRIDRIDSSGSLIRILDYKTGSSTITANDVVKKRTHIQLPLYAHLLPEQKEFNENEIKVDNIGVYDLRKGEVKWLANEKSPLRELINEAVKNATAVVNAIRMGKFCAQPGKENTCKRCNLQFTCGYKREEA